MKNLSWILLLLSTTAFANPVSDAWRTLYLAGKPPLASDLEGVRYRCVTPAAAQSDQKFLRWGAGSDLWLDPTNDAVLRLGKTQLEGREVGTYTAVGPRLHAVRSVAKGDLVFVMIDDLKTGAIDPVYYCSVFAEGP